MKRRTFLQSCATAMAVQGSTMLVGYESHILGCGADGDGLAA